MRELAIEGLYMDGDVPSAAQLAVFYGYFVESLWEIGGSLSVTKLEDEHAFGTAAGFLSMYLTSGETKSSPYFGLQLGTGFGEVQHPFMYGVYGGVKMFVSSENLTGAALVLQPFYTRYDYMSGEEDVYGVALGVSIFWP